MGDEILRSLVLDRVDVVNRRLRCGYLVAFLFVFVWPPAAFLFGNLYVIWLPILFMIIGVGTSCLGRFYHYCEIDCPACGSMVWKATHYCPSCGGCNSDSASSDSFKASWHYPPQCQHCSVVLKLNNPRGPKFPCFPIRFCRSCKFQLVERGALRARFFWYHDKELRQRKS